MSGVAKYVGALIALALCSACAGGGTGAPSAAAFSARYVGKVLYVNERPVTAERFSPLPRYATIVPDRHRGSKKFEYIFNDYETYASIFDYPRSTEQIGSIYGDGGQGCSNVLYGYGNKTFWNIGGPTQITEYRVPQTPIKTLSVSYSFASSCAMNTNGDLAVGILYGTGGGDGGQFVIFKNGSGSGTVYKTPLSSEFFNGYDNQGNLFATGLNAGGNVTLIELPKGSSRAEVIKTPNTLGFPGSVQWDGKYVTVFDQDSESLYQYTVSGTSATLKNTIRLTTASDCAQTWIVKGLIYCGDAGNNDGEVFKYPAGGAAIAVFTGNFDLPLGVTAAKK